MLRECGQKINTVSQFFSDLQVRYVMTQQDPDLEVRKSASDIWTTCCAQCAKR